MDRLRTVTVEFVFSNQNNVLECCTTCFVESLQVVLENEIDK